ncbi:NifB/NifX family molybdenum-iron cluster-binding protein [Clostridium sp. WLY-B-L2]|uniref:NifB/NifX family molybdenum-iron cluster-binding protein n=1 Tax=Clostridium aromativorans TaxID=2836848 RepID=A0ABS8N3D1_9CLOT|nr:NifB/NifX family molybdenum-iron cluster-binding protein [Clostridium aromativorans]MCC9294255.1 NifB/NifX family molybdenum-iron cluster-binding protein [Clostridium aromativorans]
MIISVPYENGQIFQHFGRTEQFKIYKTENNKITDSKIVSTNGNGHGALVNILKSLEVSILICGGIGEGAQNALAEKGIQFFGGVSGSSDNAVKDYLEGNLNFDAHIKCNHHQDNNHSCTNHVHNCSH